MSLKKEVTRSLKTHDHCFACSPEVSQGLGLMFSPISPTKVQALFMPSEHFQGYSGRLHGGITSTLLDAAMTHCLFQQGICAVTADLQVRFMHPIFLKQQVRVEAELLLQRRGFYQLSAAIWAQNVVLAKAEGKFIRPKTKNAST